jgi:hypothetical protein
MEGNNILLGSEPIERLKWSGFFPAVKHGVIRDDGPLALEREFWGLNQDNAMKQGALNCRVAVNTILNLKNALSIAIGVDWLSADDEQLLVPDGWMRAGWTKQFQDPRQAFCPWSATLWYWIAFEKKLFDFSQRAKI